MPLASDTTTNPYYQLRGEDPVEWHLWNEATVEIAQRKNKNLRVVIGSYYSQDAHFLEKYRYRDEVFARHLNDSYVNVIVDLDEIPAFEHYYRSILVWYIPEDSSILLNFNASNLPMVMTLDCKTMYPTAVRNEILAMELQMDFSNPSQKLVVPEPPVPQSQSSAVIQFPGPSTSDTIPLWQYRELMNEYAPVVTAEFFDELDAEIDQLRSDHPTGAELPRNILQTGKVARYLIHRAAYKEGSGDKPQIDHAAALLTRLARSPYFDHVDGGFFQRYVMGTLEFPGGVKRLSTSAYLLEVYTDLYLSTEDPLFFHVIEQTTIFLMNQIQDNDFYPTTVSDLANEGPAYFTWNKANLRKLLTEEEFLLIETLYSLDKRPNYGRRYLLDRTDSWQSVVDRLYLDDDEALTLHHSALEKMSEAREAGALQVDDREDVLTTALVCKALVVASLALEDMDIFQSAINQLDHVTQGLDFGVWDVKTLRLYDGKEIVLESAQMVALLDTLLTILADEWSSDLYDLTLLFGMMLLDGAQAPVKGPHRTEDPEDKVYECGYHHVPDFFPTFDYHNDRESESAVLIRVMRRLADLIGEDAYKSECYDQCDLVARMVPRQRIEHIEDFQELSITLGFSAAIFVCGPEAEPQRFAINLQIPTRCECSIYYLDCNDKGLIPEYLPKQIWQINRNRVTAYTRDRDGKLHTFTNIERLNDYLRESVLATDESSGIK